MRVSDTLQSLIRINSVKVTGMVYKMPNILEMF